MVVGAVDADGVGVDVFTVVVGDAFDPTEVDVATVELVDVVDVSRAALNVRTSCGGSPLFVSGGISDVGNDGNGFVMADPVAVVAPLDVMETVT